MYRVTPVYGEGTTGPEVIICKATPKNFTIRLVSRIFNLFRNEVRWFDHKVSALVGIPQPEVFFAHYDPKHARYCIMMEDLSATCDMPPKQTAGTSLEQGTLILSNLAKLHAFFENKVRSKGFDWINKWDDPLFPLWSIANAAIKKNVNALKSAVLKRYNLDMTESGIYSQAGMYLEVMRTHPEPFTSDLSPKEVGGECTMTLMHGDARCENFFFKPFRWIDFQLCREAPGECDVGYYLSTSLPVELARKYECALVRQYHQKLQEAGGGNYSLEECFFYVQLQVCIYLVISALACA
jgi:hypothetical protein